MANGQIIKEFSQGYKLIVDWTSTPNVATNSSVVKANISLYCRYRLNIGARSNNKITIDGVEYSYNTSAINVTSGTTVSLASITTGSIAHNTDGSKSISISCNFKLNATLTEGSTSTSYTTITASGVAVLDNIARASTVTAGSANIGKALAITINKSVSNFTHTLTYAFGSLTGTIVEKTTDSTYSWTLPTTFYGQIKNATKGSGSITCQTYNGSTLVGSSSTNFTALVDESTSKPTLNPTVVDANTTTINLTGNNNTLVKYYSNAAYSIGAVAQNSATLSSQRVTYGGKSLTSASGTINAVETGTFVFSATDSRGYTVTKTINKTFIEYVKLTCDLNKATLSTDGVLSVEFSGNYYNGSFGANANSLTVQYRYKLNTGNYSSWENATATKSGNTYSATASVSGLNYNDTYIVQTRAVDKLATINSVEKTVKSVPVFDWGENDFKVNVDLNVKNSGFAPVNVIRTESTAGAAIRFTNSNGLLGAVGMSGSANSGLKRWKDDFSASYNLLDTGNCADYVVQQGTTEKTGISWSWRKWNSGVAECWGKYANTLTNYATNSPLTGLHGYVFAVELPFTFADQPTVNVSANIGNGAAYVAGWASQTTTTAAGAVLTSNLSGSQSLRASIQVNGRWK